MRAQLSQNTGTGDLRRFLDRLDGLPTRPLTARQVLALDDQDEDAEPLRLPASAEFDPAWAVERARGTADRLDPLASLARLAWWLPAPGPVAEALTRLWRHSVAVGFAARRLAREADDPNPDEVGRAGMLADLGLWAIAAVAPDRLVAWLAAPDLPTRRDLERRSLGESVSSTGRTLADRWGCERLVVESAWLHADLDSDLGACSDDPARLALIQRAFAQAERTPWALAPGPARDLGPLDPRVRILIAEVQSRCGGAFVEPDASSREERLSRDLARLRLANLGLRRDSAAMGRLVRVVAGSPETETPDAWAERAGLAWCEEPGVASARVVWSGSDDPEPVSGKPASTILALGDPDRPSAHVHLWRPDGEDRPVLASAETLAAWDVLAREIGRRDRATRLLDDVIEAHRGRVAREDTTRRRATLEALAEFAGGAGHELNNPLAVIVGRGQLLLARATEPDAIRSLRAIITQAQRAHRILRDLMYIARPPVPRPRPCQPDEIARASVRDIQDEAEARGVRVVAEARDPGPRVWVDPDPLRQVADVLVRNALEATPSGGVVRLTSAGDARKVRWTIHDTGRGIGPIEGAHLFDPFYCGRQAGRGLGLGLPRAARIATEAGGELKWYSVPGQGTTFEFSVPVGEIPSAIPEEKPGAPRGDRASPHR